MGELNGGYPDTGKALTGNYIHEDKYKKLEIENNVRIKEADELIHFFGLILSSKGREGSMSRADNLSYAFPNWKADEIDEIEQKLFAYWKKYKII